MIDLIRAWRDHTAYGRRMLGFSAAFLVAEVFYKFHSFALECVAFLTTWLVLDLAIEMIVGRPQVPIAGSRSDDTH